MSYLGADDPAISAALLLCTFFFSMSLVGNHWKWDLQAAFSAAVGLFALCLPLIMIAHGWSNLMWNPTACMVVCYSDFAVAAVWCLALYLIWLHA